MQHLYIPAKGANQIPTVAFRSAPTAAFCKKEVLEMNTDRDPPAANQALQALLLPSTSEPCRGRDGLLTIIFYGNSLTRPASVGALH
jgi:hypothetical protein